MRSTSLGKQRANRPSHRNGAVRRFLAALSASVIVGFGIGAPIAAAQARSAPRHDGGGDRSDATEHLREQLERLIERARAERREHQQQTQASGQPPTIQIPPTTVPPPVVQPSPPVPVPPVIVPTIAGTLPPGQAGRATVTATASHARVAAATGARGVAGEVSPQAPTPPAAAPKTVPRSPVARALRTARSYGALLALAAAVLAFLMIQGRLDRRDPRILSAPAEDRLSFRDFE